MPSETILIFGKNYITSEIFIQAMQNIEDKWYSKNRVILLLDCRKDYLKAQVVLNSRAEIHYLYNNLRPFKQNDYPIAQINEWERLYGIPNLRRYILSERILADYSSEKKDAYLFNHLGFFEAFMNKIKPSIFISGIADSLVPWLFLEMAKTKGVKVYSLEPARFGNNVFVTDNAFGFLNVKKRFETLKKQGLNKKQAKQAKLFINGYCQKNSKPAYMVEPRKSLIISLKNLWRFTGKYFQSDLKYRDFAFGAVVKQFFYRRIRKQINRFLAKRLTIDFENRRKYLFFPLHFEPECAVLVRGVDSYTQAELIKLSAESLPVDCWLYLKEHPLMNEGMRPSSFYQTIAKLPRVRLLKKEIDSAEVIKKSDGIVTISGTVGWEALMHKKPVAVFGNVFYNEFTDGVIKIDDFNNLSNILMNLKKDYDDNSLMCFITAVLERVHPGLLINPDYLKAKAPEVLSDENISNFSSIFQKIVLGEI